MTSTDKTSFRNKAADLVGISYSALMQMDYYTIGDGSKIEPSQITTLRCDGVVEYVYEYYGYKVGGGTSNWDISLNLAANYLAHTGSSVTPSMQYSSLLTQVTTTQSDLY